MTCHWFSPSTLVSSTNNTDPHDIADILLKVAGRTTGGTTSTDLPTRNIVTTNALNCDDDNVEAASK